MEVVELDLNHLLSPAVFEKFAKQLRARSEARRLDRVRAKVHDRRAKERQQGMHGFIVVERGSSESSCSLSDEEAFPALGQAKTNQEKSPPVSPKQTAQKVPETTGSPRLNFRGAMHAKRRQNARQSATHFPALPKHNLKSNVQFPGLPQSPKKSAVAAPKSTSKKTPRGRAHAAKALGEPKSSPPRQVTPESKSPAPANSPPSRSLTRDEKTAQRPNSRDRRGFVDKSQNGKCFKPYVSKREKRQRQREKKRKKNKEKRGKLMFSISGY